MENNKKSKIGLALGSGGVKGLAHIGVIKVLQQNNIPISYLAGSSVGALISASYAAYQDIKKIEQVVWETNWRRALVLIDPAWKSGLIGGRKVGKLIEDWFGDIDFSQLKIPLIIVATDLISGQEIHLKRGSLVKAIRASLAVPPVFKPVEYENYLLSDGGLSNPLPADVVREMGADIVIGVNLDGRRSNGDNNYDFKRASLSKISIRALNIMRYNLAKNSLKAVDVLIEPPVPEIGLVGWNKFFDRNKAAKIIKAGENATLKILPEIKKYFN